MAACALAGMLALQNCAPQRQGANPSVTPSISVLSVNASTGQSANVHPYAILTSKTTGRVRLDTIMGNGHQCSATKLFIGLADSTDLPMFVRLIQSHRVVDSIMIDDPTSGHQVYKLRGVIATGKTLPPVSTSPLITLEFASMHVSGCDRARPSSVPAWTAPPIQR
jgi:hypothetical protein